MALNFDDVGKPYYDAQEWVHDSPYGHLHLRDLFAAFALAGLIAQQRQSPRVVGGPWLAAEAYFAADAMLAQRTEDRK